MRLKEQQVPQEPQSSADFAPVPQKPVSLDQIVDRYIVRYERESIPLEGQGLPQPIDESAGIKELVAFLLEQAPPPPPDDEEEPPAEDPTAPPPDASGAAPGGPDAGGAPMGDAPSPDMGADASSGGEPPTGTPPVMNTPQLNINNFCRSAARMLNNFDVLLNPKTIILNRMEAYIKSNYDERTAKYFVQVMDRNYGVKSTSTEYPEDESFPTPYSGMPGAGGGAGG